MKTTRSLATALFALPVAALPAFAMAQTSSAQIYGRIDMSANYHRFGATATASAKNAKYVSSDTSWLGFRGTEDLGGGMRASFKMEHGFNADTGAASVPPQFWNRETWVGLGSNSIGTLQIGSQYTPALILTTRLDPFRRSNTGAIFPMFQQGLAGILGYPVQYNNSLQYLSPTLGGVSARLLVAATEGAAPGGRPLSASLDFSSDRLFVGAAYSRVKVAGAAVGQPAQVGVDETTWELGATYRFDAIKLHSFYIKTQVDGSTGMRGGMLGASIPVGAGEIATSVLRRDVEDAANSDASTFALQYTHFLSKRTLVYVGGARQTNHGNAAFGLWPSRLDSAGAGLPTAGATVTGLQLGMRHVF